MVQDTGSPCCLSDVVLPSLGRLGSGLEVTQDLGHVLDS